MTTTSSSANTAQTPDLAATLSQLLRIRFFEEKAAELRKAQDIVGSIHLCIGQEAIPVGARAALTDDDKVFATYRGHGWALACGVPPALLFAELMGRQDGVCGGRGGSALLSAPEWGFYGENSIVGAGTPIAAGAALAARLRGEPHVSVVSIGDGAMNQGGVHEAMNFAAYLKLPVLFICENNTYSELTFTAGMVADPEFFWRARAYGMPGVRIDGNDVREVHKTVAHFAAKARAGGGPARIEAMTERLVGHYWGDMQGYRPAGEVTAAKEREPIVRLRRVLLDAGMAESALDALAQEAKAAIDGAAERARGMPVADATRESQKEHRSA